MDIKSFNKKLNKISALTDTGNDGVQLSALERDLLLSYIRDLYDLALDNMPSINKNQSTTVSEVKRQEPVVVASPPVPPIVEPVQPTISVPTPTIPVYEAPKVEEVVNSPAVVEKVEAPAIKIEPVVVTPEIKQSPSVSSISNELLAELFADEKVTDLSDKLALSPVKDLTKSMGINERIFTQQELFGNNQTQFNDTLQRLNNCQNFEEAKQYLLENVINVYDWTNEQKLKKAATFVKLVKRKFSS
jgi:hypothetical protein